MQGDITEAVARLKDGETQAVKHLFSVSYSELKRLAHARLWASNLHSSFATESLVHESYLRLANLQGLDIPDRKRYFAYASKVMRSVILDTVREAQAERRGGGEAAITLNTDIAELCSSGGDVQAVDDALKDLQRLSPDPKRGLTWGVYPIDPTTGTLTVSCQGLPAVQPGGVACNPDVGDTPGTARLSVLCFNKLGMPYPVPNSAPNSQAAYWSGGVVAEHHMGQNQGWKFGTYGHVGKPGQQRFWVHIKNQPNGNVWHH